MRKIVWSDGLKKNLPDLKHPLEICDENGRILGHFLPVVEISDENGRVLAQLPPQQPAKEPILSKDELERRLGEPTYTSEEVIRYLESL